MDGLSAADAALRQRTRRLVVHLPCGRVRGPVPGNFRYRMLRGRWQSCPDEDVPVTWDDCDVSSAVDLCRICLRGTAGGPSRWEWTACDFCLAANYTLELVWGQRPFALGRHSIMNGVGVSLAGAPEVVSEQTAELLTFLRGDNRLTQWRRKEYARLAAAFPGREDVPLSTWQNVHTVGPRMSVDAFARLLSR